MRSPRGFNTNRSSFRLAVSGPISPVIQFLRGLKFRALEWQMRHRVPSINYDHRELALPALPRARAMTAADPVYRDTQDEPSRK